MKFWSKPYLILNKKIICQLMIKIHRIDKRKENFQETRKSKK